MIYEISLQDKVPTHVPGPVVVAADASVKGVAHIAGYLVSDGAWGIKGWRFGTGSLDPCAQEGGKRNCVMATELRAVFYGIRRVKFMTPLTVLTDSLNAAELLISWQKGKTDLPSWYNTAPRKQGRKPTLLRLLKEMQLRGSRITIQWVKGHSGNLYNEAADALASIGGRVLNNRLKAEDARVRAAGLVDGFLTSINAQSS